MAKAKSYIPEGLRTVTAHISVKNAIEAIEYYKMAFGAKLQLHSPGPAPGSTMHAQIQIGDAVVFMSDEMPMSPVRAPTTVGGSTVVLSLFVPDCDAVFNAAVAAGGKALMPLADQFWGDRYGQVQDPFGHVWAVATHKEDLTDEEIGQRAQAFMAEMAKMGPPAGGR